MKEHQFTLVLTSDPSEEEADRLYGVFNDGTISTVAGVPQVHFHREASSLEEAIRYVEQNRRRESPPARATPCSGWRGSN